MKARPRIFDLEEANALVPQLEVLLGKMEEKQETFQRRQDELFFEEIVSEISPADNELQNMEGILSQLEHLILKIQEMGCFLRHRDQGWVDFLAKRDGEWVYYCWRRGEKGVQYFHRLREDDSARRPLE